MANLRIAAFDFRTANLSGGAGTEVRQAGPISFSPPTDHGFYMILGWGQVSTNVGLTTLTPRVRRLAQAGFPASSPVVGEGNALAAQVAPAATEPVFIMVGETLTGFGAMDYNFTLDSAGATYTMLQSMGLVLCFE